MAAALLLAAFVGTQLRGRAPAGASLVGAIAILLLARSRSVPGRGR